jgi:hypothetical protein
LCGFGERVQSPVGGPLLVFGLKPAAGLGEELARRGFGEQGDDPGALILREAGLAARAGAISETIYSCGIEAVEASTHGLGVAAELLGYLGGTQSLPAQGDDPGSEDPITGGVAAAGELVNPSLLFGVFGRSGAKQFRHVRFSLPVRRFGYALICTDFEERSTSTTVVDRDVFWHHALFDGGALRRARGATDGRS